MNSDHYPGILFVLPHKSLKDSSVLQSQVLETALVLKKLGYHISMLLFDREGIEPIGFYQDLLAAGIDLYVDMIGNQFFRFVSMKLKLKQLSRDNNFDFVYFRDIWGGLIASIFPCRNSTLIYDLRAVIAEESAYRHNRKSLSYYLLKRLETILIKRADRVSVVSEKLKEYVLRIALEKPIYILPSAVNCEKVYYSDIDRKEIRNSYSINPDDLVFVYIGSISKWQQFSVVAQLLYDLLPQQRSLKLMVITKEKEKIMAAVDKSILDSLSLIIVDNVPHEEVYKYLSAADFGFLIRENHILNIVSSPIKFAEYLACGVPVITTPWVGDYSDIVERYDLGTVIDPADPNHLNEITTLISEYQNDPYQIKSRCIKFAEQNLSWKSLEIILSSLYQFDGFEY